MVAPRGRILALCFALTCGCTGGRQAVNDTGVLVVVRSDLVVEREIARVQIETTRHDGKMRVASLELKRKDPGPGQARLPLSFAIYAAPGDLEHGLELRVSAFGPDALDPRVRRIVQLGFQRGKMLRLVVDLSRVCEDQFRDCENIQRTCGGDGTCIALAVDPKLLEAVRAGEEHDDLPLFPSARRDLAMMEEDDREPSPGTDGGDPSPMDTRPTAQPDRDGGMRGASPSSCADGELSCQENALYTCRDGAWESPSRCELGCHANSGRCNECVDGELRCLSDAVEVCALGFFSTLEPCPMGCSTLGPRCLECIPPAARCDPAGTLVECDEAGYFRVSQCYAGCAGAGEFDGDGGVTSHGATAACFPCRPDQRQCTGTEIQTCGIDGLSVPLGCQFGCADDSACREHTEVGQALLHAVL